MPIDPGAIRDVALEEDARGQLEDLALDLFEGGRPLVAAHVALPYDVV